MLFGVDPKASALSLVPSAWSLPMKIASDPTYARNMMSVLPIRADFATNVRMLARGTA
jgi:hypothetical protein